MVKKEDIKRILPFIYLGAFVSLWILITVPSAVKAGGIYFSMALLDYIMITRRVF